MKKNLEELKRENEMLKAALSFTWSAIVFGIVIGMIGLFG